VSDNLRTYTKALYGFDAVVARTDPTSWDRPSPCPDWTARDVVAHNVGMCDMIAGFAAGRSSSGPAHQRDDDPAASWTAVLDRLLTALDAPGALDVVVTTPWGEMPVDKFLGFAWADPLVHTWDLARAVGQPAVLDAALTARGVKPLARAGASLVGPGRFAPAVPVPDDADEVTKLIALSGRNPS
jgi:uncharacterized protein (TIGR03086 family)